MFDRTLSSRLDALIVLEETEPRRLVRWLLRWWRRRLERHLP